MLKSLRSKSPLLSNEVHRNRSPFGRQLPRALRSRDLRIEPLEARHLLAGMGLEDANQPRSRLLIRPTVSSKRDGKRAKQIDTLPIFKALSRQAGQRIHDRFFVGAACSATKPQ